MKRRGRITQLWLVCVTCLLCASALTAVLAAAESMTIDQLRQFGTDAHPAVRKALATWRATEGAWIQAGLGENPNVGWVADTIGAAGSAGQQGVGIEKTFTPSRTLASRQHVASHQREAARIDYEIARCRAAADVALLGYQAVFSQQRLARYDQLIATIERSLKINEQRLAAKEISRAEFLEEKIELNQKALARHQEQFRLTALQERLGLLVGREMRGVTLVPPPEITSGKIPRDLPLVEAAFLATSPEAQRADSQIGVARAELSRSRAENARSVSTAAAVLVDTATQEGLVSLGVTIPLRITNRNQGAIIESGAKVAAARHDADRVRMAIQSQLIEKRNEYDAAYATWQRYETMILADAREMVKAMTQGYTYGEHSTHELLTAQRTLAVVELEHIAALERLVILRTEWEHWLLSDALK